MKKIILFTAVVLLAGSCAVKTQSDFSPELTAAFADAGLTLLKQKTAPRDFSLPVASLVPGTLARPLSPGDFKGKVVFLNFWATWCGPCRMEMPSMEALYNKYKTKGFEILAVNSGESASDVLSFMNENRLTFTPVLDTNGSVGRAYGVQAIPTTYLIDRDGMIILRMVGSIDWNTPRIQAALEMLLN